MKLILAIVQDQDRQVLADALMEADLRTTQLKSTGSFLRAGSTTFLIGVEDNQVNSTLAIIEENCKAREQYFASPMGYDINFEMSTAFPVEVEVGGAVCFVLPVDSHHRF
ncbi:cyclic-di-AMP receptor [Aerococcaceae bacterium DSM 111176]|nr:cyclic-di-AMP receptor [Aerococcaceae bacterium DSM 111176]